VSDRKPGLGPPGRHASGNGPEDNDDEVIGPGPGLTIAGGHGERLQIYEERTALALVLASLVYLGVFAVQVLWISAPESAQLALQILDYGIWLLFVIDFGVRIMLAERRWRYIGTHPLDVLTIVLPMFRPLRSLRVFASARVLIERGRHLAYGRAAMTITVSALFIALVGALVELDLERSAPGSTITTMQDALWWAAVTMTTVGYGDTFPITGAGQLAAVGMMIVGISLLGAVTATFASWVSSRLAKSEEERDDVLLAELRSLRSEVDSLRSELGDR
jgi:voltage-gated potassium channel